MCLDDDDDDDDDDAGAYRRGDDEGGNGAWSVGVLPELPPCAELDAESRATY